MIHTAWSVLYVLPGSGLGTTTQGRPFQCSTKLCVPFSPTAQKSLADTDAPPLSRVPRGWTAATDQFIPSQRSISPRPVRSPPTAHTLLAATTATPSNPQLLNPAPGTSVHCPATALRPITKKNVPERIEFIIGQL